MKLQRFWQNRRRLFWSGIGIVAVMFGVAGVLWYRANLPLPAFFFAGDPGRPSVLWLMEVRDEWLWRKFSSRTLKLELRGTRWEDKDSGAIVEFGEDGVFRWIERPYPAIMLPAFETDAVCTRVDRSVEGKVDGARYEVRLDRDQFLRWDHDGSWGRIGRNIFFKSPGGNGLEGVVGSDGRSLGFFVEDGKGDFNLLFERLLN